MAGLFGLATYGGEVAAVFLAFFGAARASAGNAWYHCGAALDESEGMRILITGAAGFLGSHLTERMLVRGHTVVAVDNLVTGRRDHLDAVRDHPGLTFVEADCSLPLPVGVADGVDWIMHFASPASPPRYLKLPIETLKVNAEGTRHLLDLARLQGAKFFLASTSEVYGDPLEHPQRESYWGHVNPIGPRSVYDEGKRYAEAIAMAYHRHYNVDLRIVRIFNTYGPRLDPADGRVVSNFIAQALAGEPLTIYGDGTQTRSFQYVDDLIDGIEALMAVGDAEPVNLGNPNECTMVDLAHKVLALTGSSSRLVYCDLPGDDPKRRCPDISRAEALLGWRPRIELDEGLRRTIAWMRERLGYGG